MFLMSQPGVHFSTREIADGIYWYREDGGPISARYAIQVHVSHMMDRFSYNGLNLRIKNPATSHGFMFLGVEMIQPPARSRSRRLGTFTDDYAGRGSAP